MLLTTSEIKAIINDIEDKFPVEKWLINDIYIWPLIRIQLYFGLFHLGRKSMNYTTNKRLTNLFNLGFKKLKGLINFFYAFLMDLRQNADSDKPVDVLFLTYSIHRTLLNGRWYDKFCEPFIDVLNVLNMKSLVLEMSEHDSKFRIPRYSKSKFIQPKLDYIRFKDKFFKRKTVNASLDGFNEFIEYWESKNYQVKLPNIGQLQYAVNQILDLYKFFKKIIEKTGPSIVFIADYYSLFGFAMNLACKHRGIKTVDIQHGIQGDDHMAYGSWTKLPDSGYELLPSIFWCWSEYEAKSILKWNKKVSDYHQPFIGGNLWLNMWQNEQSDIIKYYDDQIKPMKINTNKTVFILFTPGIYSDIKDWLIQAMKLSPNSYQWWVRLHPCMNDQRSLIKNEFNNHSISNIEIDHATDLPLPALLRHADVNITACSTTVIESEYFGVPSILIDSSGISLFTEQINSGIAITAYTTEALLKALKNQVDKKSEFHNKYTSSKYDNQTIIKQFISTHM